LTTKHVQSDGSKVRVAHQRILVTGATGFIGSSLCRALRAQGAEVHGTSRALQTDNGVLWWQADLSEPDEVMRVFQKVRPSTVFHLASHVSGNRALATVHPTLRDNLLTTVNILTAASEVDARVILAGSMEECEPGDPNAAPGSPYAAAKTAAGTYARMFQALYDLPIVHLRLFMVYGPGQRDTTKLVPYVTSALLRGEQPRLTSGRREVDWIYLDDVVAAFLAAAEAPATDGRIVDVGSGHLTTIRSLVERLVQIVGGQVRPLFGALNDRPLQHRRVADLSTARRLIGWQPRTPLDAGLERTVQWYRNQHDRNVEEDT
jgi:UDP-glucose 4-epimerase